MLGAISMLPGVMTFKCILPSITWPHLTTSLVNTLAKHVRSDVLRHHNQSLRCYGLCTTTRHVWEIRFTNPWAHSKNIVEMETFQYNTWHC
jgi:hypothetical protein